MDTGVGEARLPPLPQSLSDVRIGGLPPAAFYISDFITEHEEQSILAKITSAPKPRWKQLTHRRLQTWPSDLVNNKLLDAPLPAWLQEPVITRLASIPSTRECASPSHIFHDSPHGGPNHVLINEYPAGVGIMPHKDGPAYHPVVCTVSLGSSLCLNIYKNKADGALDQDPVWRIIQEPRSILITSADLYTDYLHGIADITEDIELSERTIANWSLLSDPSSFQDGRSQRTTRTSLTYRDVMAVTKLGNKFSFLQKR
ncbi:alkylated DNA repair protein alkB homolog-like 6 [Microdochium nivale]|nr:alkylated DNA repair protein alkB homolog-like 6 [Microdochium nivale]